MKSHFNFQVKVTSKSGDAITENQKLIRKFLQKWKKSGILKEIRDREAPVTKGQKTRLKKKAGMRRSKKS
jgi:ribosomal protein S21|tara:strand:+ start:134 stop:343 length:210 start_codon:yes stop_codon:yes gene_type:complete